MELDTPDSTESPPRPPYTSGPRRYMSKRQSACDSCRARKSACQIETAPPCRLCMGHNKPCTFTGRKVKRPGSLARKQSASITPRNQNLAPRSSAIVTLPAPQVHSISQTTPDHMTTTPNNFELQNLDWNDLFHAENGATEHPDLDIGFDLDIMVDDPPEPSQIEVVDRGNFEQETNDYSLSFLDEMLKANLQPQTQERSLDNLPDVTAQLCGLTGDMDPYVLRRYRYDNKGEFCFSKLSIRTAQDSAIPVQFLLSPRDLSSDSTLEAELEDGTALSPENERQRLSNLIPEGIGKRLIGLFFRFVAAQFPILSKREPPDPESAPIHLLGAIYSIALPFATYDDRLCIDFAYKAPSAQKLFNLAWKSLNRSLHAPTLATVQAALILLLRPPSNELVLDSAFKWALLGTLVSTAQTIGLHLDVSHWKLPKQELLLRKRLSWAVFAFDKWFALSLGRPSHINSNDWLLIRLEASDIEDEYESFNPDTSLSLQLSHLTVILDHVLVDLYQSRAVASLSCDHKATLKIAQSLLKCLTNWYQNLDPSFHASAPENLSGDPDPRFSIHLCYHAVKITILRALLRPFCHAGAAPPQDPQENADWHAAKAHCRLGAKAGASAAVKSMSSLRACHYQAFWAPWCKTHFALFMNLLCLLTVTSPPDDSAAFSALNHARQIYRVQARSFSMVRFALLRIDALFWVGFEELINKNADESPIMTMT